MADDSIAAKREARRRRILQNSQARLEKITGRPLSGTQVKQVSTYEYQNGPVDAVEKDDYSQPAGSSFSDDFGDDSNYSREDNSDDEYSNHGNNTRKLYSKLSQGDNLKTADGHANSYITNPGASGETRELLIKSPNQKNLFIFLKLHLLLLAIIVRLLYYFDLGFVFGESIFVPFIVVETSHLLVLQLTNGGNTEATGIIGAVMLLGGISPESVHRFTKVFNLASKIGGDFSVFFVTFVFFHCAIEELS